MGAVALGAVLADVAALADGFGPTFTVFPDGLGAATWAPATACADAVLEALGAMGALTAEDAAGATVGVVATVTTGWMGALDVVGGGV